MRYFTVSRKRLNRNSLAFIELQNKINPDFFFDKRDYKGATKPIIGTCKKCGTQLSLAPQFGWTNRKCCPYCNNLVEEKGLYRNEQINSFRKLKRNRKLYELLIKQAGNFEVNIEQYFHQNSKIDGKCIHCGTKFRKKMESWIRGFTCPTCFGNNYKKILEEKLPFFDFSEFEYLGFEVKSKVKCKQCGKVFYDSCNGLLYCDWDKCYHVKGNQRQSISERKICDFLDSKGIKYETEKTFDDLLSKNGKPLRFDFYLPDYGLLIEYNGDQHYRHVKFSKDSTERDFIEAKKRDKQKAKYARERDYILLVINENYEKFSLEQFFEDFSKLFDETRCFS